MLLEKNLVGNKDDWANYITIADELGCPMLGWLPVGSKPVNVLHRYQADAYDAPKPVAHVDGKDWDTFKSAAANRKEFKARIQWVDNTCSVSKLAEDVSNTAGVADELAREIKKKMTEMSRIMECTFGCDQEAAEDDGSTGNQTAGMGAWIKATAQTVYPVPAAFLTPAASIYSGTQANFGESDIKAVLASRFMQTGQARTARCFCGLGLKQRFADMQFFIPNVVGAAYWATQATARVTNRDVGNATLGNVIDFYQSDGGRIELEVDLWLANVNFSGGSVTKANFRG